MSTKEKKKAEARKQKRAEGPARAELRKVKISARRANVVAGMIRGKSVDAALTTLAFQRKRASGWLAKALESAVANADERGMDIDRLVVADVQVDKGPIMRRWLPRAQGRATRIRKQTSHIRVALEEK